jgi:TRAP-type C4-dicarboxylate transport system substrate-binding protein
MRKTPSASGFIDGLSDLAGRAGRTRIKLLGTSLLSAALVLAAGTAQAQTAVRWLSQSQTTSSQHPVESGAMEAINGKGFKVDRKEFQAIGINMADGLRLIRAGTFDVASIQVGLVASDDAFLEGIDLIGVSTDILQLRAAVSAYRAAFAERLEKRFGVRPVAIWPFGGQIFFCNQPIATLDDLKGKKVRSFTASMSALLQGLGATPVTLAFPEVYPALQRGVASCGITSATSANTGKWPEVTTHILPLSVSGAVQAHVVNLAWWNRLSAEQRAALEAQFTDMEDKLWDVAAKTNGIALSCSTGGSCDDKLYRSYNLRLVKLNDADFTRLKTITQDVILGEWAARCERVYPGCTRVWNQSVGAARGMTAPSR